MICFSAVYNSPKTRKEWIDLRNNSSSLGWVGWAGALLLLILVFKYWLKGFQWGFLSIIPNFQGLGSDGSMWMNSTEILRQNSVEMSLKRTKGGFKRKSAIPDPNPLAISSHFTSPITVHRKSGRLWMLHHILPNITSRRYMSTCPLPYPQKTRKVILFSCL